MKRTRISEVQAKNALRKANPDRQYSYGSVPKFMTFSGRLVDLFAFHVERRMKKPANSGRGCRVPPEHIEICFAELQSKIYELILQTEKSLYGDEEE